MIDRVPMTTVTGRRRGVLRSMLVAGLGPPGVGLWALAFGLGAWCSLPLAAQTGGAGTGGLVRLAQEQRLAGNWRRVLMIGAHPDDENTELLTILARGQGIETAYLSLTRGDGGQNLIGRELGEDLGVLRTEELAAARRIDGGRQFFTRAFDFGFSKTAEETLRFWNRDSVLKDMVRVIRRFRPQVIISVWSGTPADGHGHHQASGILAPEAYRAAGDPARFPELIAQEHLPPWQPSKLYLGGYRQPTAGALRFDGGVLDTATGLSLHQIAMRSRSQHRSQNQGNLEDLGSGFGASVHLVDRVPGITGPDDSIFAGITPEKLPRDEADRDDPHAAEAALIRAGVVFDATTNDDEVTPGQVLPVTLRAWNAGHDTVAVGFELVRHAGFSYQMGDCPADPGRLRPLPPGALLTCQATETVAPDAHPTAPYYLQLPRRDAMYQWSGPPEIWGEPSAPPLEARFVIRAPRVLPLTQAVTREVEGRFRDPVVGEVRRPVMVVPSIAVDLEPNSVLWPADKRIRSFTVAMEHLARDSSDAMVSLEVPRGWTVTPPQPVRFTREGERANVTFKVTAPANLILDTYHFDARVVRGSDTLETGLYRIRYPHVRDRNLITAAQARVVVADVKFPPLTTLGYVRGGGDVVPEALMNAGLPVTLLTGDALERGALDRFKVIVIGPRAYEADESLVRANPRLMRWLEAGGTLVVQYQQTPYVRGGFAPRPLNIVSPTQSRVTDETAPVTLVAPGHQLLHWPNLIGRDDFEGWVQERGLDFPPTWDPAWTPILEMHDPGEAPMQGGLLIARVGKGTAVYTGLAFHRQLPAIVPGAWRLFANLLGAGPVPAVRKNAAP